MRLDWDLVYLLMGLIFKWFLVKCVLLLYFIINRLLDCVNKLFSLERMNVDRRKENVFEVWVFWFLVCVIKFYFF